MSVFVLIKNEKKLFFFLNFFFYGLPPLATFIFLQFFFQIALLQISIQIRTHDFSIVRCFASTLDLANIIYYYYNIQFNLFEHGKIKLRSFKIVMLFCILSKHFNSVIYQHYVLNVNRLANKCIKIVCFTCLRIPKIRPPRYYLDREERCILETNGPWALGSKRPKYLEN